MKRHLMVLITLLFVATSSWGVGFTGLDRIWMQDATLNGSANQYWGTVDAFLEANELDALGNPVFSTVNVVGSGLSLGTAGTTAGNINFKSTVAAHWMDLRAGAISTDYIWTLPLVASGGANYLVNVDVDGTMGYTDPGTLGGGSPEGTAVVSTGVAAGLLLQADGDNTSSWTDTILNVDFVAGTTTNNTLGAITRTATHVRMGTGAAMVTLTNIVASGTSVLGTGAISSATCATVVTTSATGAATTDVIGWGFNGDPTAVTGYVPLTTGMLTIIAYPTANNVNYKVCNNTASSITPGAVTLNWRIDR